MRKDKIMMDRIATLASLAALAVALTFLAGGWGCANGKPTPAPTTSYRPASGEITNGVTVQFVLEVDPALHERLVAAGATVYPEGAYVFPAVDSQERRDAVTAALAAGATLKGSAR